MIKHPAVRVWVKRGLVNSIEGLYLSGRMQRQTDTPASTLAAAGFKNTAPFLEALEIEAGQATADKVDLPAGQMFADMTFDTFVQTNSNVPVVELLFRVCRDSPFQSKLALICGGEGQGKTHLLYATEHEVRRLHPEKRTILVNMLDLVIALIRARRRGNRGDFIGFLSRADTLLIDDIQLCEADAQVQDSLLELLERQPAQDGHRLVMSCDVDPGELQLSDGRLKAAIANIAPAGLKALDRVERGQMAVKLSGGFNLPSPVIDYIAENVSGNTGELRATVAQLIAASRHRNKEVSLELALDLVSLAMANRVPETPAAGDKPEGGADKGAHALNADPQMLKEMIRSARDKTEYILANEIALSQMIRVLSGANPAANRPQVARLRLALQAVREGDMETASELAQPQGAVVKQSATAPAPLPEDARGSGPQRQ